MLDKPKLEPRQCDDVASDENGQWTQICIECLEKFDLDESRLDKYAATGVCGIKNCNEEADHYYDL